MPDLAGERRARLSAVQNIDPNHVSAGSVLGAHFLEVQFEGLQRFVATRIGSGACELDDLVPEWLTAEAKYTTSVGHGGVLARAARCTVLLQSTPREVVVRVAAETMKLADELADEICARIPEVKPPGTVRIATWHSGVHGPQRSLRRIETPTWNEIAHNYPERVRAALAQLVSLERPVNRGKLVLWHGEPGTGKTTAIRALIREWNTWCNTHYVADPERLFADTGYLTEVISPGFGVRDDASDAKPWRLVVAEDSDEFLKASARQESGAALARLLNISDGILGQGSDIIILLTTNERLDGLHPALTRPGRCLAEIEFTRFSAAEGVQWLGDECGSLASPLTLAELIEVNSPNSRIISVRDEVDSMGLYL